MTPVDWQDGRTGFLTANGASLEYAIWGPPPSEAMTLVLLHEGLGCIAMWRDVPRKLAEATGLGVFAYTRAGYGHSDPAKLPRPLEYMTHEAVNVLPDVLEAAGVQRAVLLGHSDGGTIAAIYAGSVFDPRLRGAIVMAPHFFTEPMGQRAIAAARVAFETQGLKERLARYHKDPDATFRGWADAWLDPGAAVWDVTDVLDYIRVPVLAIQGDRDEYGTLAQIEVIEARSYAPVELQVLDDCGHSPHLDHPDQAIALVADFVARLERIERASA